MRKKVCGIWDLGEKMGRRVRDGVSTAFGTELV